MSSRTPSVYALDMVRCSRAPSSAGFRGAPERCAQRLKKQPNSILFIDEIHTIVGAGATSGGSMDASNILKPALASGELKCIARRPIMITKATLSATAPLARRFKKSKFRTEPRRRDQNSRRLEAAL